MSTTPGGPNGPEFSPESSGPGSTPEYLDSSGPAMAAPGNDNKKRLVALGALVVGGAVVAGGAWAATSFFSTGAQPAEALPASTIAYASVDLDPAGGQKIEAIKTLRKFPAFTDEVNLDTDDDLRERLFEEITKSGECEGLDYADDVKPWLGSRAAMAAVDLGEDQPAAVGVVQVSDAGKAEEGMATLVETCGGSTDGEAGGWVVDGDWMVVAETKDIAQQVVDATDDGTLAADSAFGEWTGEAGDDGFMSFYVAKSAAKYLEDAAGMGNMLGVPLGDPLAMTDEPEALGFDEECFADATTSEEMDACFETSTEESPADDSASGTGSEEIPPELQQMINDFDGAAATVRFDDGSVEVEYAMSNYQKDLTKFLTSEEGVDMVSDLPEDTIAAFGFSLGDGWAQGLLDYVKTLAPDEAATIDDQLAQFETETGLSFPEDVETLLGEGVTVSVGSGIDPDAIANGGPEEIPVGIKIKGDAGDIQAVLDKISAIAGPEAEQYLQVTEGDGYAVLAFNDDYRGTLESDSGLGGSDVYSKVIDGDAQTVLFVNFDADDDWLVRLTQDEPELSKNLEPLSSFGVSGWVDGDVVHGMLKLTTD
ncbi:DUF3352 domain-containing protein [Nocardioides oleivorans]|uniref:DUF3352 domain-containing protein n=1 Tax=Nocardioides oleivorans TaxID=273676 RepID=A0A4Q2S592_9ACTN|nr:DUF3352 domain-containing protein [Nocardioides oleivorans]RYB95585.1 DUF3352 domain-containing protein [Nocardioides oleivorans]